MNITSMIDKSRRYLLTKQKPDGSIYGETDFGNIWSSAAYLLLLEYLGINHEKKSELIKWIVECQNEDGSWGLGEILDYQDTLMALAAIEAYMDRDRAERAREWIQTFKGNKQLSPYAELFLSISDNRRDKVFHHNFFLIAMSLIMSFVPEKFGRGLGKLHMKFPRAFSWSVYFYPLPWVRTALTPLHLIFLSKNKKKIDFIRRKLVKRLENKLLKEQLENGSWFGISEFTLASIYALHELGYSVHDTQISKGLRFINSLMGVKGDLNTVQLPVWETSLAIISLTEADLPPDNPVIIKAGEFLMKIQTKKGGWPFSPSCVPDNDDTAFAILALSRISSKQKESAIESAIGRGLEFLTKMQNDDGSWSLYCKNQSHVKSKRGKEMWVDACATDITGHVLQALSEVGLDTSSRIVEKAIRWLKKNQTECGAWWGRWGICYIYGTSRALHGLNAVGEDLQSDYVLKAINWLKEIQNPDGGWGEQHSSYYSDTPILGRSTVEQTSWALSALIDVGIDVDSEITETIKKGVAFLYMCQKEDGSFPSAYTAVSVSVCKYKLYSVIFPLLALSKFEKRIGGS